MYKLFFAVFLITTKVYAQTNLPEGIWHPRFIFGTVKEISSEFNNEGELNSIGRFNQTFNSDFLKTYISDFEPLVNVLNLYSPGYNIGDQINLGSLEFSGGPNIFYFAPALGYGVTKKWSVGVALPVVTLKGKVDIIQKGINNTKTIREMISKEEASIDGTDGQFSSAFDRMTNVDLIQEFNTRMQDMGYYPITYKNETVLGDLQVLNIYNYFKTYSMNFYLLSVLNLPTGKDPNPNDLMSINIFDRTYIDLKSHHEFNLDTKIVVGTSLGVLLNLPDKVKKRVPQRTLDILPEQKNTETLKRKIGNGLSLGLYSRYNVTDFLTFDTNLSYGTKNMDYYSGEKFAPSKYSLLSNNSNSKSFTVKLGLTFTTSNWFIKRNFSFPFMLNYTYSDVLAGVNVARQARQEASILLFF